MCTKQLQTAHSEPNLQEHQLKRAADVISSLPMKSHSALETKTSPLLCFEERMRDSSKFAVYCIWNEVSDHQLPFTASLYRARPLNNLLLS